MNQRVCDCGARQISNQARQESGGCQNPTCNTLNFIDTPVCGCNTNEKPVCKRLPTPCFMPQNPALAMAYVPMQQLEPVYCPALALQRGTAFPGLDKPFCGMTVQRGGCRRV